MAHLRLDKEHIPASRLTVSALALMLLLIPALPARAGTLDQSQETQTDLNTVAVIGVQVVAQTFTAGQTGALDEVDLLLSRYGSPGNLTVEVQTTLGGVPTGTVLASATVTDASLDTDPYSFAWVRVPISPAAAVSAATQYAIVLRDPGGAIFPSDYFVWAVTEDLYPRGMVTTNFDGGITWFPAPGADFAFRTYVAGLYPTNKDQCKNGGWMTLVDSHNNKFRNQGDCVSFVATQGNNLGGG